MRKLFARFDILLFFISFVISISGEYFEAMSLLEEQSIAFRHALRNTYGDSSVTAFPSGKILLLSVDEDFYGQYGGYPLKRSDLARMVENLDDLGARVIACNFFLKYPSIYDEDSDLARVLKNSGNTILASHAFFDAELDYLQLHYPAPLLSEAAETGYVDLTPVSTVVSIFGRLKFYPDLAGIDGGMPLAAKAVAEYMNSDARFDGPALKIGGLETIPLNRFNEIYIDFSSVPAKYRGLSEFHGKSAYRFFDIDAEDQKTRQALREEVEDKIVVIGDSSSLSNDWYDTPVGKMYGVEILAESVATLLKGAPLRAASLVLELSSGFLVFFALFLCCVLIFDPKKRTLLVFLVFVLFMHVAITLYVHAGVVLSMTYNLLFGLVAYTGFSLFAYVRETRLKTEIAAKLREKQKSLERAEENYRSIFENAAEGIFQATPDGVLTSANPAMAEMLGHEKKLNMAVRGLEMASRCFASPEEGGALFEKIRREEKIVGVEKEFRRKDDSSFPGIISARVVRDDHGNPMYCEGSVLDITERKQKEKAEREREAAIAKNEAKSEFLAMVAHEIRNPLGAISLAVESLLDGEMSRNRRNTLETVKYTCKKLTGILDDILNLGKIEEGVMQPDISEFELRKELESLADLYKASAVAKKNELILDVNPEVPASLRGDCARLTQVVGNLTSNALKFTENGEICIGVDCLGKDERKARLLFYVRDSGLGVSEEQARKIFSPYVQAEKTTAKRFGGIGLGLYIGKTFVELMGGEIQVRSECGNGSKFFFELKLEIGGGKVPSKPSLACELDAIRALVIDESESSLKMLARALESFGCEVVQAESATRGREELLDESKSFDLVVIDDDMPGPNGLEALEAIRRTSGAPKIPVVLMSDFEDEKNSEEVIAKSADAFISKPVKYGELLDAVVVALVGGKSKSVYKGMERSSPRPRPARHLRGARVLLAEDNPFLQRFVSELLEKEGIRVTVAGDGKKALEAISENRFDAVLMDGQMPVMDGYEATRRIRSDPRFDDLPVIALTASVAEKERYFGLECGMNDHLKKPVEMATLFSVLSRWIKPEKDNAANHGPDLETNDSQHYGGLPERLPGLNVGKALERLGGNVKLFRELMDRFARQCEDLPGRMRAAAAAGNRREIAEMAHGLRGMAGTMEAGTLAKVSEKIENALEQQASTLSNSLLEEFENAVDLVLTSASMLEENESVDFPASPNELAGGGIGEKSQNLKPRIAELTGLIERHNLEAGDYLKSMIDGVSDADLLGWLNRIAGHIERFDFDSARESLQDLGKTLGYSVE